MATSRIFCPFCSSPNIRLPTPDRPYYSCAICGQTFQLGPPIARAAQADSELPHSETPHGKLRRIVGIAGSTAFCIGLLLLIVAIYYFQYHQGDLQDTGSMEPTLKGEDAVFLNPWARNFQRGDLVVFPDPTNKYDTLLKRIVGLPGETIAIKSGQLFINNGVSFHEPWLPRTSMGWIHVKETRVNPDNFYVLGDNRNISLDSTEFGGIHCKLIRSKVFVILDADPFGIQIGKGIHRRNGSSQNKPMVPEEFKHKPSTH